MLSEADIPRGVSRSKTHILAILDAMPEINGEQTISSYAPVENNFVIRCDLALEFHGIYRYHHFQWHKDFAKQWSRILEKKQS